MKMMEVFILKFQTIAQYQIPEILSRWYVYLCVCRMCLERVSECTHACVFM